MSIYDKANATIGYMQNIAQALEDVGTLDGTEPINPTALENLAANIRRMPLTTEISKLTLENQCGINIPSGYEPKVAINKISGRTIREDKKFIHHPTDRIDSYFLDIEGKENKLNIDDAIASWNKAYQNKYNTAELLFTKSGEWYVTTEGNRAYEISRDNPYQFADVPGTYTFYFEECARGTATYYVLATNTVNTNSKGVVNLQAGVHKFGTYNECNSFYFTYGTSCTPDMGMEGASFKFKNFKIIPGALTEQIVNSVNLNEITDHCTDYGIGIDENICNYIYWKQGRWYYKQMCELMSFSQFVKKYTQAGNLTLTQKDATGTIQKKCQYFHYTFNKSISNNDIINNYFNFIIADIQSEKSSFQKSTASTMCLCQVNGSYLYIRPTNIESYFTESATDPSKLQYAYGTKQSSVTQFEKEMADPKVNLQIVIALQNPITTDITQFMSRKRRMLFISTNENNLQAQSIVSKNTRNGNKVATGFLNAKFIGKTPREE